MFSVYLFSNIPQNRKTIFYSFKVLEVEIILPIALGSAVGDNFREEKIYLQMTQNWSH